MKKILAGILVLTVFLGGCGGSKASKSPELVREAFGTTFSEVKENFGWEMEKNQMKEQIEPYYEEERVVGYSMELEDVELPQRRRERSKWSSSARFPSWRRSCSQSL